MRVLAVSAFFLLTQPLPVKGQAESWKEGGYRNSGDLWSGTVTMTGPFAFRSAWGLGLEDHFKVNQLTQRELRNIWAIFQDGSIYLNMELFGMGDGFLRVREPRTYTYFIGAPRNNKEQRDNRAMNYGLAGGLIGGLIGVAVDGALAPHTTRKIPYLLNLESGQINELTERHMLRVLEPYSRLYNAYRIDEGRLQTDVALLYIELLNDAVEYGE